MKTSLLLLSFLTTASFCFSQTPAFEWAITMEGSGPGRGQSITVDENNNVYTTGSFNGTIDFDPGPTTYNLNSLGGYDIFIQKLDEDGNLLWVKQIAGNSNDISNGIISDTDGNIYVTGYFQGTVDFDPNSSTYNLTSQGGYDVFVLKIDETGDFLWAKQMGGASWDKGTSIVIDKNRNIYTTGTFQGSANFDPSLTNYTISALGSQDVYIQKLDENGNFLWAKQIGGSPMENGSSIGVDTNGNVYVSGGFEGTVDFDPSTITYNLTSAGNYDIFIQKLDENGNFLWVKQIGGVYTEHLGATILDVNGNIFTIGWFEGVVDFNPGAASYIFTSYGGHDTFIQKLDKDGNFLMAKYILGTSYNRGNSLALDAYGNIYMTGGFALEADFDPSSATFNLTSNGDEDIYILKLNEHGSFVWAMNMGGDSWDDEGRSITTDGNGNIYTTGNFIGTADFDPSLAISNLTSLNNPGIFIQKLSQNYLSAEDGFSGVYQNGNLIYPNPNNGNFTLNLGNIEAEKVTIYNALGKLTKTFYELSTKSIELDLISGIYFIHIQIENTTEVIKFIVK